MPGAWSDVDRPVSELPWSPPGQFRLRANRADPVCARCESALEGRGGEGEGFLRDMATALLPMQARIAAAVDHALGFRARLAPAARGAPSRRPAHAVAVAVAVAAVAVRALTLVAIRDLLGEEMMALERAPERAPWLLRRPAPRRPVSQSPRPPALWPGGERRSPADYRPLAREILAHPDWAAAAELPERRRRRVLGRLIDAAPLIGEPV